MTDVVGIVVAIVIIAFFALIVTAGLAIAGVSLYGVFAMIVASIRKSSK